MKTVKSMGELHTLALRTGAEVVIGDNRFNTARAVVPPPPAPKLPLAVVAPPVPSPPLPEYLTRGQVEQLLAQHEARMFQRLEQLLAALKPAAAQPSEWVHQVTYDRDGAVTAVRSVRK